MKSKFLIIALITIIPSLGFAAVFGDFEYTVTKKGILINSYTGPNASVKIPSKINNVSVTAIDNHVVEGQICTSISIPKSVIDIQEEAFNECSSLLSIIVDGNNPKYKSVNGVLFNKAMTSILAVPCATTGSFVIPNSVKTIGDSTFGYCTNLTSITISSSVTTIFRDAFNGCENLTNITIPKNVTLIHDAAIGDCPNLKSINVDSRNPKYKSVNGVLFNKTATNLIAYPAGKSGTYSIPNSVKTIGGKSFQNAALKSITIPSSVTSIGEKAFDGCGITNITIPNSVKTIGDEAFEGCNLTTITIPSSVTSIGEWAFGICQNLKSIYFRGNPPQVLGNGVIATSDCVVYYLRSSRGWGVTYAGLPTQVASF